MQRYPAFVDTLLPHNVVKSYNPLAAKSTSAASGLAGKKSKTAKSAASKKFKPFQNPDASVLDASGSGLSTGGGE